MRVVWAMDDVAIVALEATGRSYMYNVVYCVVEEPYRRLGLGTAVMKAVCADADREGIELWLVPQPIDLPMEGLVEFYAKLGFEGPGGGYMIRKPKKD